MDRREALSLVSLLLGGTIVGGDYFLSGCQPKKNKSPFGLLDPTDQRIISEIADVILPKTNIAPGAKEIEIGKFINSIVTDCYSDQEQKVFTEGLKTLEALCDQKYGENFMDLKPNEKHELLLTLEAESEAFNKNQQPGTTPHYYTLTKQLTIWGYLSSETVQTKVLEYTPIPGRYEGCLPYQAGDKVYI